mmetsp:Transcript_21448/g.36661  ORF Transcript_21448/g.36661 Transcript_21448/m.36661 type:complete len:225 (+) Transcript_21448:56-730(+)
MSATLRASGRMFTFCALFFATPCWALSRPVSRRTAGRLTAAAAASWAAQAVPVQATPSLLLKPYADNGVTFGIPDGWVPSVNELSDGRRLVAAVDPNDSDANVFIAFTPVAADYTSLGSFGTREYVGGTIIPECSKSKCSLANGDSIEGQMLEQATVRGNYVYDYTIESAQGDKRHLRSLFSIAASSSARTTQTLVTLTAQCLEPRYVELAPTFNAVIDSFKYA